MYHRYNRFMRDVICSDGEYDKLIIECLNAIKDNKIPNSIDKLFSNCPKSYIEYRFKAYMINRIKIELVHSIVNNSDVQSYIRFIKSSPFENFIKFKNYIIRKYADYDMRNYDCDIEINVNTSEDEIIMERNVNDLIMRYTHDV